IPTLADAAQAEAFVAARVAEGSDWIKVVYDDFHLLGQHLPTLDLDTLTAVIAAAHDQGRDVVVHIGSLAGARAVVAAGADVLGHWVTDDEPDRAFVEEMAGRQVAVIPTLSMLASLCGQTHDDLAA